MQTAVAVADPSVHTMSRLSWRRLLAISAALAAVAILAVAAVLGDVEAVAIGTGFVLGSVLLRWRRGLAGRILLGLLFVDVLAWMALGVVTNIRADEALGAVAVPAMLSGISVAGLIAAVAEGRVTARWAPGAAAALGGAVVLAAGVAAVVVPAEPAVATTTDVRVVSEDVAFDTAALDVTAGEVTIELANRDLFWHTFTVDELGVDLAVPVNGDRQVTFDADPGTYRFYCRIPGHETRMVGALTVR
jgi:plastocyanin